MLLFLPCWVHDWVLIHLCILYSEITYGLKIFPKIKLKASTINVLKMARQKQSAYQPWFNSPLDFLNWWYFQNNDEQEKMQNYVKMRFPNCQKALYLLIFHAVWKGNWHSDQHLLMSLLGAIINWGKGMTKMWACLQRVSQLVHKYLLNTSCDRYNTWYWGYSSEQKDTDLVLLR